MITVYGSPHCPDCVRCKESFDANGIAYEFTDITGSMPNLKAFLKRRDTDPVFAEAKNEGRVGIPALLREDGTVTLDWEAWLAEKSLSAGPKIQPTVSDTSEIKPGQACRLDGTGC